MTLVHGVAFMSLVGERKPALADDSKRVLVENTLDLSTDDPLDAKKVNAALDRLKLSLTEQGFPFAKIGTPDIVVDHDTRVANYSLAVDLGPASRYGEIRVEGDPLFSADKAWGFMLHMREGVYPAKGDYPGYTMPLMQLATPDLEAALARLRAAGAEILLHAPATDSLGRRYTAFREPFGVPVELLEIK